MAHPEINFTDAAKETNRRLGILEDDVIEVLTGNRLFETDKGGYIECAGAVRRHEVIGAVYEVLEDGTFLVLRTMVF